MLTRRLSALVSPANHEPYLDGARPTFDAATEDAVRRFQSEHKQLVDGIYGPLTHKQLITSRRRQRRHGA
jgi:peptidoglycan hydrolase-like protein with peptidoglycan-binding domain